jgi:SOS-response transcriptional repressor LexA
MTERQAIVYEMIDEWWKKFGYAPSIDDVMKHTKFKGRGHTHRIMKQLCDLGHCKRLPNRARSIRPSYIRIHKLEIK